MHPLTEVQERTVRDLIGRGSVGSDLRAIAERSRSRLESQLAELNLGALSKPLWLGKGALADLDRCDGMFAARLRREGTSFEHSERTAAGTLFHKAVEVDVGSRQSFDVRAVADNVGERLLRDDRSFTEHWGGLEDLDRFALLAESTRRIELFRASFPPLGPGGPAVPLPELRLSAKAAHGQVALTGRVDLVLLTSDRGEPARLAIDFKDGSPRAEHAEDMRLYALLMALRYGVAPHRVATFFLESGEWQHEDVTDQAIARAIDRVVAGAKAALSLLGGQEPALRPGPQCGWCPRRDSCPMAFR